MSSTEMEYMLVFVHGLHIRPDATDDRPSIANYLILNSRSVRDGISPTLMYNFLKFPINLRFVPTIILIKKIMVQTFEILDLWVQNYL